MLTVWGRATSSNVQKVMWAISELALQNQRMDVGGPFGGLDTPQFRAMNPQGLIPVVVLEDGTAMFESNAIIRYLARTDPERRLWPLSLDAEADMWAEWASIYVQRPVTALFWAFVRTLPDQRDPAAISAHLADAKAAFAIAEDLLSRRPFLAGETLTIADIIFATPLYRYFTMPLERPDHPNVAAYYARLTERASYAEHVMVDYASLYAKA